MPFSCAGAPHAIPVGAVGLRKSNEHLGRQVALALYHIVQTTACVEVVIMIRCLAKVCIHKYFVSPLNRAAQKSCQICNKQMQSIHLLAALLLKYAVYS